MNQEAIDGQLIQEAIFSSNAHNKNSYIRLFVSYFVTIEQKLLLCCNKVRYE